MGEMERFRGRLDDCRRQLESLPRLGPGHPGPPDPETGERWDRLHTLGHMAEMLPFWTDQLRRLLAGATEFGRGEEGYARRRQAIDSAAQVGEEELLLRVVKGARELAPVLAGMGDEELDRRVVYRSRAGDREVDVRYLLEELLVGHLEAHLGQLRELEARPPS